MREVAGQVALGIVTAGAAAVLLLGMFLLLKLVMDTGLEFTLPVVVVAGLLLAYAVRLQEAGR